MGNTTLTLAIDTEATVNEISDSAYKSLTRQAKGGTWPLQENDLNVIGVTGPALGNLGRVTPTDSLYKKVCPSRDYFYVTSRFAIPVNGILGLNGMKDLHITINPENKTIVYQEQRIPGIVNPSACQNTHKQDTATLKEFLKIAHYSEIKPTLVQVLEQYRVR